MTNRPDLTALAALGVFNVVQNRMLNERGYVTGNIAVTAGLIALAQQADLDRDDMGLSTGELHRGLTIGVPVLLASLATAAIAPHLPAVSAHLRDERVTGGTIPEAVRRAAIRFPLGTALFEEVAFRGVLPALLGSRDDPSSGDLESAVAFALWHLIPTHHALVVNRGRSSRRVRVGGTILGAAAAGIAGYGLSRIRRRTGSLLAPWLVHSSVNAASYLAVALAQVRRD